MQNCARLKFIVWRSDLSKGSLGGLGEGGGSFREVGSLNEQVASTSTAAATPPRVPHCQQQPSSASTAAAAAAQVLPSVQQVTLTCCLL